MRALILLMLFLSGCSSVVQKLDDTKTYRYDIRFEVTPEGQKTLKGEGALIVPKSSRYQIKGRFPGDADLLIIQSCHRDENIEKVGDDYKYEYIPLKGMEDDPACPLNIYAFNKEGQHSFGYIDFEEPTGAKAKIKCNGEVLHYNSVSFCQSKAGLEQEISFEKPVNVAMQKGCEIPLPADKMNFRFNIPLGDCQYNFKQIGADLYHRLTTRGYDQILIRK